MKDHKLLNELYKEVEAGRVTSSSVGPLTIFKYTQDCHIKSEWNDVNRQARGIIFKNDGTVVARPFAKFFNLNEVEETKLSNLPWSEGCEIHEKLDGSCGAGYLDSDGCWALATPGSMESVQAKQGTLMLRTMYFKALQILPRDCTPVFEIIYPGNRIVVDYKGELKLVLLAIFEHNGEEWHPRRVDKIAENCGFDRPKVYNFDISGDIPFEENAEGYVVRFGNGLRVKIKSPTYLRIHRLLDYLSPKGVVELIRGKEYGATVEQLPDSIVRDFDDVRAHVQGMFYEINNSAKDHLASMEYYLGFNKNRKDQALWIQKNVPNELTGFVFGLLDNKDIEDGIWRLVIERVKQESS